MAFHECTENKHSIVFYDSLGTFDISIEILYDNIRQERMILDVFKL